MVFGLFDCCFWPTLAEGLSELPNPVVVVCVIHFSHYHLFQNWDNFNKIQYKSSLDKGDPIFLLMKIKKIFLTKLKKTSFSVSLKKISQTWLKHLWVEGILIFS